MLQALYAQKSEIGSDIFVQAENVIRRNISKVDMSATTNEKKIFHAIGIPGF